jgi:hypothetical protein
MNTRILGYAVLIYAALTSSVPFALLRFILNRGSESWWTVVGAVLWLAYVAAGFGFVFGRAWSRKVLLVASAGSIIEIIASAVILLTSGAPLSSIAPAALWTLPQGVIPVAIFVVALKARSPEAREVESAPAPVANTSASPRLDLAYACFSWIALVLFAVGLLPLLSLDYNTGDALGMLVMIPVAMATLLVGLVAVVLSIVLWREWPLLLMSAIIGSMLLVFLVAEEKTLDESGVVTAGYFGATAVLIFLCARWFAFTRRRAMQTQ